MDCCVAYSTPQSHERGGCNLFEGMCRAVIEIKLISRMELSRQEHITSEMKCGDGSGRETMGGCSRNIFGGKLRNCSGLLAWNSHRGKNRELQKREIQNHCKLWEVWKRCSLSLPKKKHQRLVDNVFYYFLSLCHEGKVDAKSDTIPDWFRIWVTKASNLISIMYFSRVLWSFQARGFPS
jgi:hypothetical protein